MAAGVRVVARVRQMAQISALLCIMALPVCTHQQAEDYVDPTDMSNFDPGSMKMKTSTKPSQSQTEGPEPPVETPSTPDKQTDRLADSTCRQAQVRLESFTSLFSQLTNRLVHLLDSKVSSVGDPVEVNLRLRVSHHDLVKLRKFGEGGDRTDIHVVHETLSHMIMYASDVLEPDTTVSWLERKLGVSTVVWWMRHTTQAVITQLLSIMVLFVVLLLVLSRIQLTRNLVSWLLVLIFLVSVIFTWMELYQAISLAVVKTITIPLGKITTGIRQFFVNLLKDLPIHVLTLMIAIVVPFIGMAMLIFSRYHVRILGILHIGPANDVPQITQERPRDDTLTYQDQQQQRNQPQALPRNQPQALPSSRSESPIGNNIATNQWQPLIKGHKSSPLLSHEEIQERFDDGNEDVVKELNEDSDEPVDGPTHDSLIRLQHCSENKDKKNVMFKTVKSESATQVIVEKIEPVASEQVESVDLAVKSHQFNSSGDGHDSRQTDPTAIGSVVVVEQRLRLQQLTKTDALSHSGQGSTDSDCATDALSHSGHLSTDSDSLTDALAHSGPVSTDSDCLSGDLFTPAPPSLPELEMSASFEILARGFGSNMEGRAAE